jgi:hypothetical protein
MSTDYPKTITLPSGRQAKVLRKIKVRDSVYARRVVGSAEADNAFAISLASLAPTVELDGRQALYEDLLELDIDDMTALGEAASVEKKMAATPSN